MGSNPTLSAINALPTGALMLALALHLLTAAPAKPNAETCVTVSGTYAIYVGNDLLHIDGSRHRLVVVSDALDKDLMQRGWQDTKARGLFTLCGPRADPRTWTIRDRVELKSSRNIRFIPRP